MELRMRDNIAICSVLFLFSYCYRGYRPSHSVYLYHVVIEQLLSLASTSGGQNVN